MSRWHICIVPCARSVVPWAMTMSGIRCKSSSATKVRRGSSNRAAGSDAPFISRCDAAVYGRERVAVVSRTLLRGRSGEDRDIVAAIIVEVFDAPLAGDYPVLKDLDFGFNRHGVRSTAGGSGARACHRSVARRAIGAGTRPVGGISPRHRWGANGAKSCPGSR